MIHKEIILEIPPTVLETWQSIVDILAEIVSIPSALIMRLNGPEISVLLTSKTPNNPYHYGDKEQCWGSGLYCETVLKTRDKLLIPNALIDDKWKNNPDIELNMISYLGFPIFLPDGSTFGTICILDTKENGYSILIEKLMINFRTIIQRDLEILQLNQMLGDKNRRLIDYLTELQALRGIVPICAWCKSIKDDANNWRPIEHYLTNNPEMDLTHGICPTCAEKFESKKH